MSRTLAAAVIAIALAGAALSATVLVPADFKDIVSESTVIVRGHVTDVRAIPVDPGGIDSIATVAVESTLKGTPSEFVYVRVPGGVLGSTRRVMIGAPVLRTNQQLVLFLKPGPDNMLRPIGLSQGVFPVQPDPSTGQPAIAPPVVAGQTASGRGAVTRGDPRRKTMSVPEFESLVRLVMSARGAAPRIGRGGGGR